MPDIDIHGQLAESALRQYPISDWALKFLRHNENLVYRVTERASNRHYLLRIHLPRHDGFRGLQQTGLAIESELAWLHALKRDTDLVVQQPLCNIHGALVTMITGFPDIREVPCTLLTWIDGVLFSQEDSRATTLVRRLGALNAQLHAHARVWIPPQPFLRLSYDAALLHDALAKMEHGIRLGVITREDAQNVFEAGSYILRLLAVSERRPDTWGLIHADLLSDNVLVQGETLIPIDFSLSGFGYYWLDLGICLGNLKQHLRQGYLEGYGMPITNDQRHVIEACTIMIIVVSAMRHVTNAGWHAWFQRRFPVIAQHYCPMLLRKQEFIFDI